MLSQRYANLAFELAEKEKDNSRKRELLKIAEICKWLPEIPPRNFHEALQSCWFVQLIPQIETNASSVSPGRFNQYMYPFYEKDIDEGIITRENALELLECLWIKFSEPIILYNGDTVKYWAGYPQGQVLDLGGQTKEGKDATNELSYMYLEAQADVALAQPNLGVRIHRNTPGQFLKKVCEVIRIGSGMPQLFMDEAYIPGLLRRGIPLEEALDYGNHGCTEGSTVATWGRTNGGTLILQNVWSWL